MHLIFFRLDSFYQTLEGRPTTPHPFTPPSNDLREKANPLFNKFVLSEYGKQGAQKLGLQSHLDGILWEVERPVQELGESCSLQDWVNGDHVGLSSLCIAKTFDPALLVPIWHENSFNSLEIPHPRDLADLGRCFQLVRVCSIPRSVITELGQKSAKWKIIDEYWDNWRVRFEAKDPNLGKECYEIIHQSE